MWSNLSFLSSLALFFIFYLRNYYLLQCHRYCFFLQHYLALWLSSSILMRGCLCVYVKQASIFLSHTCVQLTQSNCWRDSFSRLWQSANFGTLQFHWSICLTLTVTLLGSYVALYWVLLPASPSTPALFLHYCLSSLLSLPSHSSYLSLVLCNFKLILKLACQLHIHSHITPFPTKKHPVGNLGRVMCLNYIAHIVENYNYFNIESSTSHIFSFI